MKRPLLIIAICLTLGPAGAVLAYLLLVAHLDRVILSVDFRPIPLDSEVWKATPSEFSWDSVRLRMVDDRLATRPLVGQHQDDIVALIGEPDDTPYFREYAMVYHLGQERHPFGIDSEWLVIQLDDQMTATECLVVTD